MSDLEYSSSDLTDLGTRLKSLGQDIRNDGHLAYVGLDQVAHPTVVDALEDFAGDWDDKRKALSMNVEHLGELATKSSEEFGKADKELADKISEALGEQK